MMTPIIPQNERFTVIVPELAAAADEMLAQLPPQATWAQIGRLAEAWFAAGFAGTPEPNGARLIAGLRLRLTALLERLSPEPECPDSAVLMLLSLHQPWAQAAADVMPLIKLRDWCEQHPALMLAFVGPAYEAAPAEVVG